MNRRRVFPAAARLASAAAALSIALLATVYATSREGGGQDGAIDSTTYTSDARRKENVTPVDGRMVVDRLAALRIGSWNYTGDPPTVRHIGPTAQDFRAAFGFGASDKSIDAVDANGVALSAIQGFFIRYKDRDKSIVEWHKKKDARIADLQKQVDTLSDANKRLTRDIKQLDETSGDLEDEIDDLKRDIRSIRSQIK